MRSVWTVVLLGSFGLSACSGEPDPQGSGNKSASSGPAASETTVEPEAIEQALEAADLYVNSGRLVEARQILARLIERAPREIRARELMGQVLTLMARRAEREGRVETAQALRRKAHAHYEMAVELDPDSAGLHHSAGLMAQAAGDSDAALAHFERAAELDPLDPYHALFAAQVLIATGELDAARDHIEHVIELDPDEPVAYASLAMIDLEREQFDAALEHIGEARAIAPDDLRFIVQEARIRRLMGDPERSIASLAALSADERADAGVASELAAAYGALDRYVDAAATWAHRYERRSDDPRAYLAAVRAAEALLRAGRRSEASEWLDRARILSPRAPEVLALEEEMRGEE